MEIYVPSYGRARAGLVTRFIRRPVKVVVVPEEAEAYRAYDTLVCPVRGIAATRQWIIEQSTADVVLMLDDDLRFAERIPGTGKFRNVSNIEVMLDTLELVMEDYAHGAVHHREMANNAGDDLVLHNCRMLRALAYRPEVLRREGIRFDRLRYMEDFDVALSLLELGYDSASLNTHVQTQGASSAPGGCSAEGRGPLEQAQAAIDLAILHPDSVKVVTKKVPRSGAWTGFGQRVDVSIQWKKARAGADRSRHV